MTINVPDADRNSSELSEGRALERPDRWPHQGDGLGNSLLFGQEVNIGPLTDER